MIKTNDFLVCHTVLPKSVKTQKCAHERNSKYEKSHHLWEDLQEHFIEFKPIWSRLNYIEGYNLLEKSNIDSICKVYSRRHTSIINVDTSEATKMVCFNTSTMRNENCLHTKIYCERTVNASANVTMDWLIPWNCWTYQIFG